MSKYYAIDIGRKNIKACVAEISRKHTKLTAFHEVEIENEPDVKVISDIIRKTGAFGSKSLTVNYPSSAFVRTLEFPFSDIKKIESLIPYEIGDQIPVEPEDVMIVHGPLIKTGKFSVLAIAGEKSKIASSVTLIENAGASASKIIYSPSRLSVFAGTEGNTLVVDMGAGETELALFIDGKLYNARNYNMGSEHLLKKLASYSGQEIQSVREWIKTSGEISFPREGEEGFEKVIRDFIDYQIREWEKFILDNERELKSPIHKVLLVGEGSALYGLPQYVSAGLQRKTEYATLEGFGNDPSVLSTAALVLASQKSKSEIPNFRTGMFSLTQGYSLIKHKTLAFMLTVSVFALLLTAAGYMKYERLQKEETALLGLMGQLSKEVLGKKSFNAYYINRQIKKRFKKNKKINPKDNPLPKMSAYKILGAISEIIPPSKTRGGAEKDKKPVNGTKAVAPKIKTSEKTKTAAKNGKKTDKNQKVEPLDLDITFIKIKSGKITIKGTVKTASEVEILSNQLKKIECFSEINTGKIKTVNKGEDEKREFSLDINNDCL